MNKRCPKCGETKPHDQWPRNRSRYDGLDSCCKTCRYAMNAKRHQQNPQARVDRARRRRERNTAVNKERNVHAAGIEKRCHRCGVTKPAVDFHRANSSHDGLRTACKACDRTTKAQMWVDQIKPRVAADPEYAEQRRSHCRASYLKNRKKRLAQQKKYNQSRDKAQLRAWRREYFQKRRDNDPLYRMISSLRTRTHQAVKAAGLGRKLESTISLLGCSTEDLKSHLEQQFKPGMTWDNYGQWHVDHIRPCADFDLSVEAEQRACFHYTNLQPLWRHENLSKGARYEG